MSATETPSRPSGPDAPVVAAVPEASAYRRILRRETHSSRSGAAVIVLIALVIVSAWVGIESVYAGLGLKALLFSPLDSLATLVTASTHQGGLVIAVGIVTGIVGVILVIIGLTPGRRGRHTIDDPRVAVVVDDQVVAASLARRARLAGSLAPGQVNAWVSRTSARITITPASGARADDESVLAAAREELDEGRYKPAITPHVRVSDAGRLGA